VICSDAYWLSHISSSHPEMKGRAADVAAVVKSPEFVNQDATYPNRRVYYRSGIFGAPLDQTLLKIVVEYPTIEIGTFPPAYVVTAYSVLAPKRGELPIWPRPDQPTLL
jgi:hypothetical protein